MLHTSQDVSVEPRALGFVGDVVVRDVWQHTDWPSPAAAGTTITARALAPHDSALLLLTPTAPADKSGPSLYPWYP